MTRETTMDSGVLRERIERLRDWIEERVDVCAYGEMDFEACGHNRKHGICLSCSAARVLAQDTFVSDALVVEKHVMICCHFGCGKPVEVGRLFCAHHAYEHPAGFALPSE
jgi:hypothetical protein